MPDTLCATCAKASPTKKGYLCHYFSSFAYPSIRECIGYTPIQP